MALFQAYIASNGPTPAAMMIRRIQYQATAHPSVRCLPVRQEIYDDYCFDADGAIPARRGARKGKLCQDGGRTALFREAAKNDHSD